MRREQLKMLWASLVAACLFMFGALCAGPMVNAQANEKIAALDTGDRAPDFTLQNFNGKSFTFSELLKKKGVLLWFTNLCGGCQSEIPKLLRLISSYETKDIESVDQR